MRLYDVKIAESTENFLGFNIANSKLPKGVIPVSWDILDHGDGVLINVFHSFDENAFFSIKGAIEKPGLVFKYKPKGDEFGKSRLHLLIFGLIMLSIPVASLFLIRYLFNENLKGFFQFSNIIGILNKFDYFMEAFFKLFLLFSLA